MSPLGVPAAAQGAPIVFHLEQHLHQDLRTVAAHRKNGYRIRCTADGPSRSATTTPIH
jgi:hypothetical protein